MKHVLPSLGAGAVLGLCATVIHRLGGVSLSVLMPAGFVLLLAWAVVSVWRSDE